MRHTLTALMIVMLVAGCDTQPVRQVEVKGTQSTDFLKLRAGPGLGFRVIMGLPDGTRLQRRNCVTEVGQLWCQVALIDAPQITGYVSADYLTAR